MANLPLADLLGLILDGLAENTKRSSREASLRLLVCSLELELPTYLQLLKEGRSSPRQSTRRLVITLPSLRGSPPPGTLGRLGITLTVPCSRHGSSEEEPES